MTQPPPAPRALPVLAGLSALALVVGIVVPWSWLLITGIRQDVPDRPVAAPGVFLLEVVAGSVLLYMLAATWFATPWFERRGVLPAAVGLVLWASWPAVEGVVAGWRAHPFLQVVPEALGIEAHTTLMANLGVALLSVILLVVGAALLLSRPPQD